MSWIANNNKMLAIGPKAAEALSELVTKLHEAYDAQGKSLKDAIKEQLEEQNLPTDRESLLELLKSKLEEDGKEEVVMLLSKLSDLEHQEDATDRTLGVIGKKWERSKSSANDETSDTEKKDSANFKIDLSATGTFAYVVDKDGTEREKGLPPLGNKKPSATLNISGKLVLKGEGSTALGVANIGGSFESHVERQLTYYYSYPSGNMLGGYALAGALRRLAVPYKFDHVLDGFHNAGAGELDALRLAGDTGLKADAKLGASITTAQGVALAFSLKGGLKLGTDFQVTLTSTDESTIRAEVKTNNSRTRNSGLNMSASIGLSSLAPDLPAKLIKETSKASEFIDLLDEELGKLGEASWLKPGTILQDELLEGVKKLVSEGDDADLTMKGLARLFGLDEGQDFDDTVTDLVAEKTTAILTGILDDSLGLLQGNTLDLEQKLKEALDDKVGSAIKDKLKNEVFDKIPELDKLLNQKAASLNKKAEDALKKALGRSIKDIEEDIKSVLEDARSLVTKITDGIKASVDELIAIEVGFARERSRQRGYDYSVLFEKQAADEFSRAILSPAKFGEYLFADGNNIQPGVSVESLMSKSLLKKSTSSSFGIAVATIKLTSKTTLSSLVEVIRTDSGIAAGTQASLKRERKFLDETRTMTFISSNAVTQAKKLKDGGELEEEGLRVLPEGALSTTPKLTLDFQESDGKLQSKEIKKLFRRMLSFKALDESTYSAVLQAFEEAGGNSADLEATLSFSLAIPPGQIIDLIEYGAKEEKALRDVMETLFIDHLTDEIRIAVNRPMRIKFHEFSEAEENPSVDFVIRNLNRLLLKADGHYSKRSNRQPTSGSVETHTKRAILQKLTKISDSMDTFYNVFTTASSILNADASMKPDDLEEFLEKKQKEMVKFVKPFLNPGIPLPGWVPIGGKIPERSVVLFLALQRIAHKALDVAPPIIIQFTVKGKSPKTFISVPIIEEESD